MSLNIGERGLNTGLNEKIEKDNAEQQSRESNDTVRRDASAIV